MTMLPFSLGCQVYSHLARAAALLLMVVYLLTSSCQGHILQEHGVLMMLRWQALLVASAPLHLHTEVCPVQENFTVPVTPA